MKEKRTPDKRWVSPLLSSSLASTSFFFPWAASPDSYSFEYFLEPCSYAQIDETYDSTSVLTSHLLYRKLESAQDPFAYFSHLTPSQDEEIETPLTSGPYLQFLFAGGFYVTLEAETSGLRLRTSFEELERWSSGRLQGRLKRMFWEPLEKREHCAEPNRQPVYHLRKNGQTTSIPLPAPERELRALEVGDHLEKQIKNLLRTFDRSSHCEGPVS
jgi:hypothetical protein